MKFVEDDKRNLRYFEAAVESFKYLGGNLRFVTLPIRILDCNFSASLFNLFASICHNLHYSLETPSGNILKCKNLKFLNFLDFEI